MARTTCLADIDDAKVALFLHIVKDAKAPLLVTVGRVATEPLEVLRQLRFVLPTCIIVVYTLSRKREWGLACHLAGANGVLSKTSNEGELVVGLRSSMRSGCFTDPRLAAA
jgi:DNA-binding NarL/FixJ family response regulator